MKTIAVHEMDHGREIHLLELTNALGMTMKMTNLGCRITELSYVDARGDRGNIVAGYSTVEQYLSDTDYLGCVVGRFANRIENSQITLDGSVHRLIPNEGPHQLHGGSQGFHTHVWEFKFIEMQNATGVEFSRLSPHGEEGYPGNLFVTVRYLLPDKLNALQIEYQAHTDATTVINMSNHCYFNLTGKFNVPVSDHVISINSSKFLPVREDLIPTGAFQRVEETPMDFRHDIRLGDHLKMDWHQLALGRGFDHCFVLDGTPGELRKVCCVTEPVSGRLLEIWTTEAGMQLYTGNHLDGSAIMANGTPLVKHGALCLETQRFPNTPNVPEFGNAILRPGDTYTSRTVFRMG